MAKLYTEYEICNFQFYILIIIVTFVTIFLAFRAFLLCLRLNIFTIVDFQLIKKQYIFVRKMIFKNQTFNGHF